MPVHFLEYPAEVRNAIYEAIANSIRGSCGVLGATIELSWEADENPKLSQVCRQVRREWRSVFHTETAIHTDLTHCGDAAYVRGWLKTYGSDRLPATTKFSLDNYDFLVCIELNGGSYTVDVKAQSHTSRFQDECTWYYTDPSKVRKAEQKTREALDSDLAVDDGGNVVMTADLLNQIVDGMECQFETDYE